MNAAAAQPCEPFDTDLNHLRDLYDALPHRKVRWRTEQGQRFLLLLDDAVYLHRVRPVAEALGVSSQAVEYMLQKQRVRRTTAWPSPGDLRGLQSAWRPVQAAQASGRVIRRQSSEYCAVHEALNTLSARFELSEIALAMGIQLRFLRRFTVPPLRRPDVVARAVREALPAHLPRPAGEAPSSGSPPRNSTGQSTGAG